MRGSASADGVGRQQVPWWASAVAPAGMLVLVLLAGFGPAAPFARPARTVVTLAAIAFGATAVIFAFGLHDSLGRAAASQTHSASIPVYVEQFGPENGPGGGPGSGPGSGPPPVPSAAQDAAAAAALRAQPGTRHAARGGALQQPGQGGGDRR